jgi:nicotinamide-nucleotide amidase
MHAVIVSIGDELALGQTVDTNSAWLSAKLASRGISTLMHLTVADDQRAIVDALKLAVREGELVLVTGGLGPTDDDLTRQAIADLLGVELVLDEAALAEIEAFFARRGRTMNQRNRIQAMCPAGATMLDNPAGTAPGIRATCDGATIWSMPGVPREMRVMFERHVEPALPSESGRVILTTKINTFGQGESDVAAKLGDLMRRDRNPLVGTTVSAGIVSARIRSEFATVAEAQPQMDATIAEVEQCLGRIVFGRDEQTLAEVVGGMLVERSRTIVTCESCTGGLVGQLITQVAGSSEYYRGGWITYANDAKVRLGVPAALIEQHGAVSEEVASAMAECAVTAGQADYAVAVTGIAGPAGGSEDKPVGTVWIALAQRSGGVQTQAQCHAFAGDRAAIRQRAAFTALNMLRLALMGT